MFEEKYPLVYTLVYLWTIMSSPWPCRHTSGFELAPVAGGKKDVSQVDQVWPVARVANLAYSRDPWVEGQEFALGICLGTDRTNISTGKVLGQGPKDARWIVHLVAWPPWHISVVVQWKTQKESQSFRFACVYVFTGRLWSSLTSAGEFEDDVWR